MPCLTQTFKHSNTVARLYKLFLSKFNLWSYWLHIKDGWMDDLPFQGSYRNRKSKFKDFSRTFQGLFTFFQESFFMDSNSPNTAYTQDFCSIQDRERIPLSSSLFLPDFSSVYCLHTLLSFLPFPISLCKVSLCKVSLPVAFDLYYLNQID